MLRRLLPTTLAIALFLCVAAPVPQAQAQELMEYVVQKGDTCVAISRKLYGDPKAYDRIHLHNQLGKEPHKLVPGSILRLPPPTADSPDAQLTGVKRTVRTRATEVTPWEAGIKGKSLFRGWRVNTLNESWAEVTFQDTSVLQMREQTLVIIYGRTKRSAKNEGSRATLQRGTLGLKLGDLSGRNGVRVETPSVEADVAGGDALVTVDDKETSHVSNFTAKDTRVAMPGGKGRVKVESGMGTKAEKGKAPTPPVPLPNAPTWRSGLPQVAMGDSVTGGSIQGAWTPSPNAVSYRVTISRNANGSDLVHEETVTSKVTRVSAQGLPPGDYYVSVSARDAAGFESAPSTLWLVKIAALEIRPPGRSTVTAQAAGRRVGAEVPRGNRRIVLLGTQIIPPDGVVCRIGSGALQPRLTLVALGPATVNCTGADGAALPVLELAVEGLTPRMVEGPERLARSTRQDVVLALDSQALLPDQVTVRGSSGLKVDGVRRTTATRIALRITPTANAKATEELFLEVDVEGKSVRLGRVAVRVAP